VLQYHFNWKTLSAMAGVTWWNFYFRLFPGTIRSPQVVEFLGQPAAPHRRQVAGGVGWTTESSQQAGVGIRTPAKRAAMAGVSSRLRSRTQPGGIPMGLLEASRVAELLPPGLSRIEL